MRESCGGIVRYRQSSSWVKKQTRGEKWTWIRTKNQVY